MTNKLRGHPIEHNGKEWVFSDTKESTVETWQTRPCGHCGAHNTKEGHDGCLGTLPGVINACCGHGAIEEAYIQFESGRIDRGLEAVKKQCAIKGWCEGE
jgi:hypothetical protein